MFQHHKCTWIGNTRRSMLSLRNGAWTKKTWSDRWSVYLNSLISDRPQKPWLCKVYMYCSNITCIPHVEEDMLQFKLSHPIKRKSMWAQVVEWLESMPHNHSVHGSNPARDQCCRSFLSLSLIPVSLSNGYLLKIKAWKTQNKSFTKKRKSETILWWWYYFLKSRQKKVNSSDVWRVI